MDEEVKQENTVEGEIFGDDNYIRVRGARQNNLHDLER